MEEKWKGCVCFSIPINSSRVIVINTAVLSCHSTAWEIISLEIIFTLSGLCWYRAKSQEEWICTLSQIHYLEFPWDEGGDFNDSFVQVFLRWKSHGNILYIVTVKIILQGVGKEMKNVSKKIRECQGNGWKENERCFSLY